MQNLIGHLTLRIIFGLVLLIAWKHRITFAGGYWSNDSLKLRRNHTYCAKNHVCSCSSIVCWSSTSKILW